MSEKTNLLRPFIVSISLLLLAFVHAYPQSPATFKLLEIESIDIDGKEYVLEKGEMEISEDRTKANSRTLRLPILIIRSHNPNGAEPIFWLDGGPGASNILSTDKIASASPSKLLENHDFVCVGYRGVDGSTVLKSKKINHSMKGIDNQMLSDRSLDNLERKITEYSIQLRKNGIDISRYSIIDVIEDIEEVRKSLGYGSINLLSVSFGTRIALLYGYKYPGVIKRSLMIGACPPGYFLTREEQAENTLAFYDSLYSSQANAEYKGSIQEAMKKAFISMPKHWATFRLDPEKIKAGTVSALYSSGSAVWAFNCYFKATQENDYSGLYMLQKIYEMNNRAVIGDVYAKTVSAEWQCNRTFSFPENRFGPLIPF